MKIFRFLNQIFAVLCYLTLGSFLFIIAFHWWPLEDAIESLYRVYHSSSLSVVLCFAGIGFVALGLVILRSVLKTNPQNEAVICRTDAGLVVVSGKAIEDVAKKILKKSAFVRDYKMKLGIRGQVVSLTLRLNLWANDSMAGVVQEVQEHISERLVKLLGRDNQVDIRCEVDRIHQPEEESTDPSLLKSSAT